MKHIFKKNSNISFSFKEKEKLNIVEEENGISKISKRLFQKFINDDKIFPINKNVKYRNNILETIPTFLADKTKEESIKNDQPTLISKFRQINEYGYLDMQLDKKISQDEETKKPIIEIKNLVKIFGDKKNKKYAVNNISFNINKYENIALLGSNGAGKTTTVEIIFKIIKQTSGEINYNYKYNKFFQEGLGIQFQDSSYPEGLKVKDIIEFLKDAYKIDGKVMSNDEFNHILDVFMIKEFYDKQAKSLSGGQQQRLNVLLAILHKPKIIFLDELTTGLDIKVREDIEQFVIKYCNDNKITIVLVSHEMNEVEKMCQRVIILRNGIIKVNMYLDEIYYQYGSVSELVSRYI